MNCPWCSASRVLFHAKQETWRNQNGFHSSFNPSISGEVYSVGLQPDGKLVIGGIFSSVNGIGRNRMARLDPDGTLDGSFNPNVGGVVYNVAVQADGKILIGGQFFSVGGTGRNNLARLNPTARSIRDSTPM